MRLYVRTCRRTLAVCASTMVAMLLFAAQASAAPPITDSLECKAYPTEDGQEDRICSGQVPSFDFSPDNPTTLDVDVTLPRNDTGAKKHPVMVLLHGFSNDKHEWESRSDEGDERDKYRWNNHWFAKHGYYVITYTARGFKTDQSGPEYSQPTPSGSSDLRDTGSRSSTIQLKSREAEIRDTQYLTALVAKGFPDVDAERVAVSGNSYGGGESWLQASEPDWTFPNEQDPTLPVLRLQAAIPKYGWTDLAYGLAPNGHPNPLGAVPPAGPGRPEADALYESSTGKPNDPLGEGFPLGMPKLTYVNGFFAIGNRDGTFEEGARSQRVSPLEGPINIPAWKERLADVGDPYEAGAQDTPIVAQARRGLTEFRGSYYQDERWQAQAAPGRRKVAIFAQQGWTDDLFPPVEAFRQYKYLKRLDPRWPVSVEVADIGHARAQNKVEQWRRLNTRAFQWLQSNINPQTRDKTTVVASEPTICANDGEPDRNEAAAQRLTATTPEELGEGRLRVNYASGEALPPGSGSGDPDGVATDPVAGAALDQAAPGTCRSSVAPEFPGRYTAYSQPVPDQSTVVGIGEVRVRYQLVGGTFAALNARVWDVAPDGSTTLLTRGAYRIAPENDSPAGVLRLGLFGNHWPLKPGHRLRLDLAQVDEPFLRRSNTTATINFEAPSLELPIREARTETLAGG